MKFLEQAKVRTNTFYGFRILVNRKVIVLNLHYRRRSDSQSIEQRCRRIRASPGYLRGKIHSHEIAITGHRKLPAKTSLKAHRITAGCKNLQYDEPRRQCCVSAELRFTTRSKPAQIILVAARD